MNQIIGRTLSNRYHVLSALGRGGMAEVYKVWDQLRSVHLAMKLLHEELALDKLFLRRFKREANNLAKLGHPNIVRFYGLEQEGRLAFMLLDYIEGETLKHKIFDAVISLPINFIREVMSSVCGALGYAHAMGMVHCDIKPSNIMIDQHGKVLLSDFGIARMTDTATATLVGMGTPAFMAPEQARGLDPVPQSDVYSIGVVLYEMLTGGERPFTGEYARTTGSNSEKVRWEQINLKPPSPRKWNPQISPALEAVVLKCLEKDPFNRFQHPLDLLNATLSAFGESVVEGQAQMRGDRKIAAKARLASEDRVRRQAEEQLKRQKKVLNQRIAQLKKRFQKALGSENWDHAKQAITELSTIPERGQLEADKLQILLEKRKKEAQKRERLQSLKKAEEQKRREKQVLDRRMVQLTKRFQKALRSEKWGCAEETITELSTVPENGQLEADKLRIQLEIAKKEARERERLKDHREAEEQAKREKKARDQRIVKLQNQFRKALKAEDWDHAEGTITELSTVYERGKFEADKLRILLEKTKKEAQERERVQAQRQAEKIVKREKKVRDQRIVKIKTKFKKALKAEKWDNAEITIEELSNIPDGGYLEADKLRTQLQKAKKEIQERERIRSQHQAEEQTKRDADVRTREISLLKRTFQKSFKAENWAKVEATLDQIEQTGSEGQTEVKTLRAVLSRNREAVEVRIKNEAEKQARRISELEGDIQENINTGNWKEARKLIRHISQLGTEGKKVASNYKSQLPKFWKQIPAWGWALPGLILIVPMIIFFWPRFNSGQEEITQTPVAVAALPIDTQIPTELDSTTPTVFTGIPQSWISNKTSPILSATLSLTNLLTHSATPVQTLDRGSALQPTKPGYIPQVFYSDNDLTCRTGPGLNYSEFEFIEAGDRVQLLGIAESPNDDWVLIRYDGPGIQVRCCWVEVGWGNLSVDLGTLSTIGNLVNAYTCELSPPKITPTPDNPTQSPTRTKRSTRTASLTPSITPTIIFSIDGNPDEWSWVKPIGTRYHPQGKPESDSFKNVWVVQDDSYVYLLFEFFESRYLFISTIEIYLDTQTACSGIHASCADIGINAKPGSIWAGTGNNYYQIGGGCNRKDRWFECKIPLHHVDTEDGYIVNPLFVNVWTEELSRLYPREGGDPLTLYQTRKINNPATPIPTQNPSLTPLSITSTELVTQNLSTTQAPTPLSTEEFSEHIDFAGEKQYSVFLSAASKCDGSISVTQFASTTASALVKVYEGLSSNVEASTLPLCLLKWYFSYSSEYGSGVVMEDRSCEFTTINEGEYIIEVKNNDFGNDNFQLEYDLIINCQQ